MNAFFRLKLNKAVLSDCHIYGMLKRNARKRHISFHTPGHKAGGWDITELSYSDNLACPHGVIAEAERDIAKIAGAAKSFILTDGSTSGVLAMLYASGAKKIALPALAHKSLFNGCELLGIETAIMENPYAGKIPLQPTMSAMNDVLPDVDALVLTSPDYYGNIPNLSKIRALCEQHGKLLLIDGAHGGHLHFDKDIYAGGYADIWVDGVHKSLPALTQGAVVSARTEKLAEKLAEAVDIFRTTSPSYPIMASVEYAMKYPKNEKLERAVAEYVKDNDRVYFGGDWTKLCALFGENAFEAEKYFEREGIYAEFCDGNVVMFYLSPATGMKEFKLLIKKLAFAFEKYPFKESKKAKKKTEKIENTETEWVPIKSAAGRICAKPCGLFPPCTPLLAVGEKVTEEQISLLQTAPNVFGLKNGKILVFDQTQIVF
jgi:lysine decarboxylase